MPHKHNPEGSEHLDTLSRLVRAHAGLLLEGMDQQHERDGRGWKTEWVSLPGGLRAHRHRARRRPQPSSTGLEVDPAAMARNLSAGGEDLQSEQILAALSALRGKHAAQALMAEVVDLGCGRRAGPGGRGRRPSRLGAGPGRGLGRAAGDRRRGGHGRSGARPRADRGACRGRTRHDARATSPRLELGSWPTPLIRARRLEARLGCGPLLVKRDDLSGFAVAGSKARPLEYLLGGAIADGHDTLVVGGVATSNFCQGAAVAARAAGLDCHIVLPGHPPAPAAANLAMALACGAQVSFSGGPREQLDDRIRDRAAELNRCRTVGARRYRAAVPTRSAAWASSARRTSWPTSWPPSATTRRAIVLAVGSGASIAGLLVGASLTGCRLDDHRGLGQPPAARAEAAPARRSSHGCADLLGVARPGPVRAERCCRHPAALHGAAGPPSTAEERAAALLALETEGLLLDADYTAPGLPDRRCDSSPAGRGRRWSSGTPADWPARSAAT